MERRVASEAFMESDGFLALAAIVLLVGGCCAMPYAALHHANRLHDCGRIKAACETLDSTEFLLQIIDPLKIFAIGCVLVWLRRKYPKPLPSRLTPPLAAGMLLVAIGGFALVESLLGSPKEPGIWHHFPQNHERFATLLLASAASLLGCHILQIVDTQAAFWRK